MSLVVTIIISAASVALFIAYRWVGCLLIKGKEMENEWENEDVHIHVLVEVITVSPVVGPI